MGAHAAKLYHVGFRGRCRRSTLADANERRDWRIFADFAQVLIATARTLYANDPMGVDLDQSALRAGFDHHRSVPELVSLGAVPQHKAAVKLHTLLDLRGNIPTFIRITDGKVHDVNILDEICLEAGAFYVMDRGYIDFERLYALHLESAFFVTRTKTNVLLPAALLAPGGQEHRRALRSDRDSAQPSISCRPIPTRCGASATSMRRPASVWCF